MNSGQSFDDRLQTHNLHFQVDKGTNAPLIWSTLNHWQQELNGNNLRHSMKTTKNCDTGRNCIINKLSEILICEVDSIKF